VIYLDTSAMVKLVAAEPESAELIEWLNGRAEEALATSAIGHIELVRAARRIGHKAVLAAQRIANSIDTLLLTDTIAAMARTIGSPELRTLDAIHVATAAVHRDRISAFCVYDVRLLAAAEAEELPVTAPGR
jgi:predicted nucleic acid-binding protein